MIPHGEWCDLLSNLELMDIYEQEGRGVPRGRLDPAVQGFYRGRKMDSNKGWSSNFDGGGNIGQGLELTRASTWGMV